MWGNGGLVNRSDETKMPMVRVVLALMVVLLVAGVASADGVSPRDLAEEAFAETDADGNASVTHEEYYRRMADMYYHADADRDGELNPAELAQIEEAMVFDPADSNKDGVLTMPEYIDQRFDTFREVDADSNGLLSREEVIKSYEASYAE
jgi:Ca2+-binding EF-hand superfamily protein